MKKVLIPLVLVFALGTGYVANAANSVSKTTNSSLVMQSDLKFISVDVTDLPDAVTKAVASDYKDAKISQGFVATTEDGSKVYKVVLQLNGESMTAMYNEDGSKYEPES